MHYKSLDGLRGVAAYIVLVSHYSTQANVGAAFFKGAGTVGVMIFFVLSGFLMGRIYMRSPFSGVAVARYYQHRVARVVPLYYLIVGCAFALYLFRGTNWPLYYVTWDTLAEHLLFLKGSNVLWTVAVEVQFYMVFPLLWFVFDRDGESGRYGIFFLVVVAFLLSPIIPIEILRCLPYFLSGLMLATFSDRRSKASDWIFLASPVVLLCSFPDIRVEFGFPGGSYWPSPLFLTAIPLVVYATLRSSVAEHVLGNAIMRRAGDISYSVYLIHVPVIGVLKSELVSEGMTLFVVATVLTTGIAMLSFHIFESPIRRKIAAISIQSRTSGIAA